MSDAYHRPFQPAYHLPFHGYPYQNHFQHLPRYSERRSFQPPYPFKQPDILHPLTSSKHPSSLTRPFSSHESSRIQSHAPSIHRDSHGATLKKRRRSSTTRPASHISEALSSIKLARIRPQDWRSGYKPPSKSYNFRKYFERFTAPFTLTKNRRCILEPFVDLNFLMEATQTDPPNVFYDLREPKINDAIFLPYLNRQPNIIDLCQLITSPPIHHMTLWHHKLPWKIHIKARQLNGITFYDFFRQIHQQLHQPITKEDYYADELSPSDREILRTAFQIRCAMFPDKSRAGVQRIDFLGQDVCFIGLKRCRGGKWEFKTRPPPPKERMIID